MREVHEEKEEVARMIPLRDVRMTYSSFHSHYPQKPEAPKYPIYEGVKVKIDYGGYRVGPDDEYWEADIREELGYIFGYRYNRYKSEPDYCVYLFDSGRVIRCKDDSIRLDREAMEKSQIKHNLKEPFYLISGGEDE